MAKLIFFNGTIESRSTFRGAASTDTDINYILNEPSSTGTSQTFDITQEQYDGFFDGSKTLQINSGTPSIIDTAIDVDIPPCQEAKYFEFDLESYKIALDTLIERKPNHSKIAEANACKEFLKTINVSDLTFPGDHLHKVLRDNNKFVELSAF
jgi:hypothetical protein